MCFMEIEVKYKKKGRRIIFIPTYNQEKKSYDTLPFQKQLIVIKNKRKLIIDKRSFKFNPSKKIIREP